MLNSFGEASERDFRRCFYSKRKKKEFERRREHLLLLLPSSLRFPVLLMEIVHFAMTLRWSLAETTKTLFHRLTNDRAVLPLSPSSSSSSSSSSFDEMEAKQKEELSSEAQHRSGAGLIAFEWIPPECQLRVFSYLTIEERGRAERVCVQWRDLIRTPLLWKCVDLTQFSLRCHCSSHSASSARCYDAYRHRMERFLDYLSRIRPSLREFRFAFDIVDCQDDWLRLLIDFIESVRVQRLETAQLNWKETPEKPYPSENATWSSSNYNDLMHRHRRRQRLFVGFFDYFTASAANVSTLVVPFDWSVSSIRLLRRLGRLQSLTLDSYFVPQTFQQETLDALLNAIPKVKRLSLSVCFGGGILSLRFSSKNLLCLDLSRCQGLRLHEVRLPSLAQLKTTTNGSGGNRWSSHCVGGCGGVAAAAAAAAVPCIYQVLRVGAPALRQMNGHRLHSDWRETVSAALETELSSCCPCPQHRGGPRVTESASSSSSSSSSSAPS